MTFRRIARLALRRSQGEAERSRGFVGAARALGPPQPLTAREAYALWADSYPPWPHNPLMQTEQAAAAPMIASTSPTRALDVGTGSGRYLPLLASTGARVVVGVDFSLPMLTRRAHGTADAAPAGPGARLARVCGDARRLPFCDASFDLVSSALMVGDVADLAEWLGEIARVLASGGHLIYSDFHPSWAARGWRRTFHTAEGRSCEVGYFPHTIAEHLKQLDEHSFDVRAMCEPHQAAGDQPRAFRNPVPVVVVFHARRR